MMATLHAQQEATKKYLHKVENFAHQIAAHEIFMQIEEQTLEYQHQLYELIEELEEKEENNDKQHLHRHEPEHESLYDKIYEVLKESVDNSLEHAKSEAHNIIDNDETVVDKKQAHKDADKILSHAFDEDVLTEAMQLIPQHEPTKTFEKELEAKHQKELVHCHKEFHPQIKQCHQHMMECHKQHKHTPQHAKLRKAVISYCAMKRAAKHWTAKHRKNPKRCALPVYTAVKVIGTIPRAVNRGFQHTQQKMLNVLNALSPQAGLTPKANSGNATIPPKIFGTGSALFQRTPKAPPPQPIEVMDEQTVKDAQTQQIMKLGTMF